MVVNFLQNLHLKFSYLFYKYLYNRSQCNFKPAVYIFCIAVLSFTVLLVTYLKSSWFSYDESNTLNIAQLDFYDVFNVLRNEHNFSFYYYILHFFSKSTYFIFLSKSFNYIIWILGLIFSYFLGKKIFKKSSLPLLFTFLLAFTPTIFIYGYYLRMYGLMYLMQVLYLMLFFEILNVGKRSYLLGYTLVGVLIALLHPTSVFIFIPTITFLIYLHIFKSKPSVLLLVLNLFFTTITLILLSLKIGSVDTFLGGGSSYVFDFKSNFFDYYSALFLQNIVEFYKYVLLMLSVFVYVVFWKRAKINKADVYFLASLFVFVIVVLLVGNNNSRHYIYFIIPFTYLLVRGLFLISLKYRVYFLSSFIIFYILNSLAFFNGVANRIYQDYSFCKNINSVSTESSLFLVNYGVVTPTLKCLNDPQDAKIVVVGGAEGLYLVNSQDLRSIVYYHSKRGGSTDLTDSRRYLNKKVIAKPNYSDEYINNLNSTLVSQIDSTRDKLVYVPRYEFSSKDMLLTKDELQLLQGLSYTSSYLPSIYIFQK